MFRFRKPSVLGDVQGNKHGYLVHDYRVYQRVPLWHSCQFYRYQVLVVKIDSKNSLQKLVVGRRQWLKCQSKT